MPVFSVTTEELAAKSSQLNAGAEELQAQLDRMHSQLSELHSSWTGQGSEAFHGLFENWSVGYQQVKQSLEQIGIILQGASDAYADSESQIASMFRQ